MKILGFKIEGLNLYEDNELFIDFMNKSQVRNSSDDFTLFYNVTKTAYLTKVVSLLGNNASGKTTFVKLFYDLYYSIFKHIKIDEIFNHNILIDCIDENGEIKVTFFKTDYKNLYKFTSTIVVNESKLEYKKHYILVEKISSNDSKRKIENFLTSSDLGDTFKLNDIEVEPNISLFSLRKNFSNSGGVLVNWSTNKNTSSVPIEKIPMQLINIADNSIKSITKENEENDEYTIEFIDNRIIRRSRFEIDNVLSSGTIKLLDLYGKILYALDAGAIMIIDEIENHLNASIIKMILTLFTDKRINKNDATLIFSTHYIEILDLIDRVDVNFICSKTNNKLQIENLTAYVSRFDENKSKIYLNDIEKVGLQYRDIVRLKDVFKDLVSENKTR